MQQPVFTWPYALFFWAVFLWAFAPEFRIVGRAQQAPDSAHDAKSLQFILLGQGLATFAGFGLAAAVPAAALPHSIWVFWAGLCVIIGGSLLRRHCFRMLGEHFSGAVNVKADQPVIERGAYRYVRHPSYTAGALLYAGIGLALGNWLSLFVLLGSIAIVYAYRVRVEEAALASVIGEPYRLYMRRTKRFVPFLF